MRLVFDGLTEEQAICFAKWFEGQGEQDCVTWFEENGVEHPLVDVSDPNWLIVEDEVIVKLKT